MWRIIYWVSPRTPEGGQAGKGDKLPPLHIHSCRWLSSKEGMWQPKRSYRGGGEAQKGRTKDKEGYINFGKVSNFAKV